MKPVLASGQVARAGSVLELGCGPGTNARSFAHVPCYVGVDLSEPYVAYATKHHRRDFRVMDVTTPAVRDLGTFEVVLMNGLMHHLDDEGSIRLLTSVPPLLEAGGEVQIVDLVLGERGPARWLARADRGAYARTVAEWEGLIGCCLDIREAKTFRVGLGPVGLWELIHVRASAPVEAHDSDG